MQPNDRAIKHYYRQVKQMLPCTHKVKKAVGKQIQCSVENYIAEHPEADCEQIVAFFGSPESIAATYVENAGTAEILRELHIRKRILAIILGAVFVALLLWAAVVTYETVKLKQEGPGYIINSVEEKQEETNYTYDTND